MTARKRCYGRRPGGRCLLRQGHTGRHANWYFSWVNPRDPQCFWCGRAGAHYRFVGGFGRAPVCADFIRLSDEHRRSGRINGRPSLGIQGQGCREVSRA